MMSVLKPKVYFKSNSLKMEKREAIKEEASDSIDVEFNNDVLRHLNVIDMVKCKHTKQSAHSSKHTAPVEKKFALKVERGYFKKENHFYAKVLHSKMHPLVSAFFQMGNDAIIKRYASLHHCDEQQLRACLNYKPKYFKWAGADLFNVVDDNGKRHMIIIETNSCPSGQKSMPLVAENQRFAGYKILLESIFQDMLAQDKQQQQQGEGDLAVVFDKNVTENSAYSAVLAELSGERVWLVEYIDEDEEATADTNTNTNNKVIKWIDGHMYVKCANDEWHKIRACLRYVTQKPWKKLPLNSKTRMINPIIACLAGGRNKIMASYAYKMFNKSQRALHTGLEIRMPYSLINVSKRDIPALLSADQRFAGKAVVKVPYGNCGQGVYTILNEYELNDFMNVNHKYDKFIVQSLIGERSWFDSSSTSSSSSSTPSSTNALHTTELIFGNQADDKATTTTTSAKSYYHVGTVPDAKNNVYVFDLRMIVTSNANGFCPVSMNCRRARKPLSKSLAQLNDGVNGAQADNCFSSWDMLGTNLSIKIDKNIWDTESERLLIMDNTDFNTLGLGIDDLIDAYVQTVLSVISIDKMCIELLHDAAGANQFNVDLFRKLNPDESLFNEIRFN